MGILEALILGIIQGLTEFFPVSSSGHLKLAKMIMHLNEGKNLVLFDLFCHLGTLFVLIFFLREIIVRLFKEERKKLFLIALSLLPLFPVYFFLKPLRDFASQSHLLGLFIISTGLILFAADALRFTAKRQTSDALWIGSAQAIALIPGLSRCASTMSCARCMGWPAKEAVQFSFLLAIPTVIGGNLLELIKLLYLSDAAFELSFSSCLIGFLSSLTVGAIMVRIAITRLSKGNFKPFAWYCIVLGIAATVYIYL